LALLLLLHQDMFQFVIVKIFGMLFAVKGSVPKITTKQIKSENMLSFNMRGIVNC